MSESDSRSNEHDQLLPDTNGDGSQVTISLMEYTEKQSPSSCIFNFVNSTLGSGVLAVPYVFKLCGYALGPIISLLFCTLATISFFMLVDVTQYTNRYQFNFIADRLYKSKWVGILAVFSQLLFIAGCLISYVIVIRDNFWFFDLEYDMLYADIVLSAIMVCIVMPLCYLKTLNKLKFNSYLVLIIILYILVVLAVYFFQKVGDAQLPPTKPFNLDISVLNGFSLTIHSYNSHYNFLNLVQELQDRTRNTPKIIYSTVAIVVATYLSVGLFGYL